MKYIPGLNGLRALAVIFVIITHWQPQIDTPIFILRILPDGRFGVNLFFVLSGFLISSILFLEKKKLSESNTTKKVVINFYIRRFLRIFPVYYVTLAVIFAFNIAEFNRDLIYYLTYTTNFHIYIRKVFGFFGHAWSLAVEEQFYLIWPFIIMFLNRNYIMKALFIFILIGPASSFIQTFFFSDTYHAYILTPECFDAFGIGGLLAYHYSDGNMKKIKRWIKILLPFSIILFFYWRLSPEGGHFQFLRRTFESIISAAAILFCLSDKWTKWRDVLLENKFIKEIGVVSYGVYLFHYPLPYFYLRLKSQLGMVHDNICTLPDYTVLSFILLMMALLSYYLLEKPILSLKSRFKY